jgi:hypothetical protein
MIQLYRLTGPEMRKYALALKKIGHKKLVSFKIYEHVCATNYDLSSFSGAVIFWTTCYYLYGLRCRLLRRILLTVVFGIHNSALALEIDFFGLFMKACLTRITFSSGLLDRPVECLFATPSFSCSCHLLMILSSGGLTPYSHINPRLTQRIIQILRTTILSTLSAVRQLLYLLRTSNRSCCPLTTVAMHAQLASVRQFEFTIMREVPTTPYLFSFLGCECLKSPHYFRQSCK